MIDQQSRPEAAVRVLVEIPRRYPLTTVYIVLALLLIGATCLAEVIR
jgi:hypothetical protein